MNITNWFLYGVAVLLLLTSMKPAAAQIALRETKLQSREQKLTGNIFLWKNDEIFEVLPRNGAGTKTADEQYNSLASQDADRLKITNPIKRQEHIKQKVESYKEADRGYTVHSQYVWQIQTDSKQTFVSGTFENQTLISHYRYYLGQNQRLIVTDNIDIKDTGGSLSPQPTEVYLNAGPAWRYRNPTDSGLNFSPEDLSLLTGKNPLAMYGANWQPINQESEKTLFKAIVPGDNNPLTVVITLDKKHGDCLSEVTVQSMYRQESYTVDGWTHFDDEWFPNKVRYTLLRPHIWSVERIWTLASIKPSLPINVSLKVNTNFIDFRLLGSNVTTNDILSGMDNKAARIVQYPFKGVGYNLPDTNKLNQIYQKDHPGESTLDPEQAGPASATSRAPVTRSGSINLLLPFLGGALFIIGGVVWMFKPRRAN